MAGLPPEAGVGSTPPPPPPKPGRLETSRMGTPAELAPPPPPPPLPPTADDGPGDESAAVPPFPQSAIGPDPGDGWLPALLRDKSAQDLGDMLGSAALLEALTHAPQTMHGTVAASHGDVARALGHNAQLAGRLAAQAAALARQRSATQAQLLAAHALERQWRQRQSDMDDALATFAPASLYQRLVQGVQEQGAVCHALEESFLDGGAGGSDGGAGDGPAPEREVADWVRRYREAKVLLYLRQERKERWDEGRVGGWR